MRNMITDEKKLEQAAGGAAKKIAAGDDYSFGKIKDKEIASC